MCAQLVVYPQRCPIFSTTQLGWLPVPYYTQHNHYTLADGKSGILKWLSPLERPIRHQNVRTCWVHVGGRLLETDEFIMCHGGAQYEGSDHAILFC